jgi:hypothetical protein
MHLTFFLFYNFIIQVAGNDTPSTLICFASKTSNAGQITSKLHVIELGAQPGNICLWTLLIFLYN